MKYVLLKIVQELDHDIGVFLFARSVTPRVHSTTNPPKKGEEYYENWELLKDPVMTALRWQELRDRKKNDNKR